MKLFLSYWRIIFELCRKEWLALIHDRFLLGFIIIAFSLVVFQQARGGLLELHSASVGIVDEDQSILSKRLSDSLTPPYFGNVELIKHDDVDRNMEEAIHTFIIQFPSHMEADLRSGKKVTLQLLIDASAVGQAGIGAHYIENIFQLEFARYFNKQASTNHPVNLVIRYAYNQGQKHEWFMGIAALIMNITMLSVLLSGAALLRERETGTIEHLLVMPVTPFQIVFSKVIANGAIILLISFLSFKIVIEYAIGAEIQGSLFFFMIASAVYLIFTTGLGIFLGTVTHSMPQMGLLFILVVLPMNLLSGAFTPLESMPQGLQKVVSFMPATAYVSMAQAILFRNADFDVVWPHMVLVLSLGLGVLTFSIIYFRNFLERQG